MINHFPVLSHELGEVVRCIPPEQRYVFVSRTHFFLKSLRTSNPGTGSSALKTLKCSRRSSFLMQNWFSSSYLSVNSCSFSAIRIRSASRIIRVWIDWKKRREFVVNLASDVLRATICVVSISYFILTIAEEDELQLFILTPQEFAHFDEVNELSIAREVWVDIFEFKDLVSIRIFELPIKLFFNFSLANLDELFSSGEQRNIRQGNVSDLHHIDHLRSLVASITVSDDRVRLTYFANWTTTSFVGTWGGSLYFIVI